MIYRKTSEMFLCSLTRYLKFIALVLWFSFFYRNNVYDTMDITCSSTLSRRYQHECFLQMFYKRVSISLQIVGYADHVAGCSCLSCGYHVAGCSCLSCGYHVAGCSCSSCGYPPGCLTDFFTARPVNATGTPRSIQSSSILLLSLATTAPSF